MESIKLSEKEETNASIIVGQLFLNFGNLEYIAFLLLHEFGNKTQRERVFKMKISERIRDIQTIAHHLKISQEKQQCIIDVFKELKKLSQTRNTVAHGPFLIKGDKQGFMDLQRSKGQVPGSVTLITLAGIHKVNLQLVALYEKILPVIQELMPSPSSTLIVNQTKQS
ncbi:MAG TPA: hypothetical protein VMF08_20205 [Candidatus Sulfotelmatobacter sp.]|nr:hypothetical protein [Candidatus Sulfotelmatobacter sp.]